MKQFKLIDAAEDDNLLDYFKSKTFNIKRGWKILNITEKEKNEILYSLAEEINVLLSASGNKIQSHIITGSLNDVCILKIRIKNPKTKAGKSSGLRTYTLVIDKGEFAILFDIYILRMVRIEKIIFLTQKKIRWMK